MTNCIVIPMWIAGIISVIICLVSGYYFAKFTSISNCCESDVEKAVGSMIIFFITCLTSVAWLLPYAPCIMLVK
jgi:hypothetical protein